MLYSFPLHTTSPIDLSVSVTAYSMRCLRRPLHILRSLAASTPLLPVSRRGVASISNVTPQIREKLGIHLHLQPDHPLGIIKSRIEGFCHQWAASHPEHPQFRVFDNLDPIVSTRRCFDDLLVPINHVSRHCNFTLPPTRPSSSWQSFLPYFPLLSYLLCSLLSLAPSSFIMTYVNRSRSDTYYVSEEKVLRTHTSAHQTELIAAGERTFLVAGDVFRRDEIDSTVVLA